MTRLFSISTLVAVLAISTFSPKQAEAVLLSLESGSGDLNQLVVGDTFTVNVVLSGLNPEINQYVDTLVAGIDFNNNFSLPQVTNGPILPHPDSLRTIASLGYIIADFNSVFAPTPAGIYQNGLFFSFELTALTPGSGVFLFEALDGELYSDPLVGGSITTANVNTITPGSALPYVISAASSGAIPEPVTALLGMMGLGALGVATGRRRMTA